MPTTSGFHLRANDPCRAVPTTATQEGCALSPRACTQLRGHFRLNPPVGPPPTNGHCTSRLLQDKDVTLSLPSFLCWDPIETQKAAHIPDVTVGKYIHGKEGRREGGRRQKGERQRRDGGKEERGREGGQEGKGQEGRDSGRRRTESRRGLPSTCGLAGPPPLLPPVHRHARLLESSGHLPWVITRALSHNSSPGVTESTQPDYSNSKPSLVQMQGQADKSEGLGPDNQMPILTAWLPDSLGPSGFFSLLLWLKARPCAQSQWADGSHSRVKSWSCQYTTGLQQLLGPLPSYPENPGRLGGHRKQAPIALFSNPRKQARTALQNTREGNPVPRSLLLGAMHNKPAEQMGLKCINTLTLAYHLGHGSPAPSLEAMDRRNVCKVHVAPRSLHSMSQ